MHGCWDVQRTCQGNENRTIRHPFLRRAPMDRRNRPSQKCIHRFPCRTWTAIVAWNLPLFHNYLRTSCSQMSEVPPCHYLLRRLRWWVLLRATRNVNGQAIWTDWLTIRCTASTRPSMKRRTNMSINNTILVTANSSNYILVQVDHLCTPCTTSHLHCPQRHSLLLLLPLLPCHRLPTKGITRCPIRQPMDITMVRASTDTHCPSTDYVSNRTLRKTNSRYRPEKRAPSSIEFSRVQQASETLDEDLRQRSLPLFLGTLTLLRWKSKTPNPWSLVIVPCRPFENGSTTNFTKGALIQLADECKRVEDVRTEDFVQTAEKSADLRLAESTTVRITPRNNNVIITFSYDNNRSRVSDLTWHYVALIINILFYHLQVDIEAAIEHPFFVYGQGWASCSPEKSMQQFGLKCQRLQVGDICLSLLPRESKPKPVHSSSPQSSSAYLAPLPPAPGSSGGQYLPPPPPTASQQLHRHDINGNQTSLHHQPPYHHPHPMMEQSRTVASSRALEQLQHLPQNLSRKDSHHHQPPLTIPTTATSTAVSSRLSGAPPYGNFPAGPIFSMPFSAANLSKPHDSPMQSHYSSKTSADQQRPLASSSLGAAFSDQPVAMVVDKPVHSSIKSTNETRTTNNAEDHRGNDDDDDDCAIDVSMSRKRRWSAPDACDEADENQRPTQGSKVPQVGTT